MARFSSYISFLNLTLLLLPFLSPHHSCSYYSIVRRCPTNRRKRARLLLPINFWKSSEENYKTWKRKNATRKGRKTKRRRNWKKSGTVRNRRRRRWTKSLDWISETPSCYSFMSTLCVDQVCQKRSPTLCQACWPFLITFYLFEILSICQSV